jgi:hypothetical protein
MAVGWKEKLRDFVIGYAQALTGEEIEPAPRRLSPREAILRDHAAVLKDLKLVTDEVGRNLKRPANR